MKKVIFSVIILTSIFVACKKDDPAAPVCNKTMAQVAANYKISKVQLSLTGSGTNDITSTYLSDDCLKNGVFQLKATDSTLLYIQTPTATCTGSGSGYWLIRNDSLYITHSGSSTTEIEGKITSWDCTNLVIDENFGAGSYIFTLTKQ